MRQNKAGFKFSKDSSFSSHQPSSAQLSASMWREVKYHSADRLSQTAASLVFGLERCEQATLVLSDPSPGNI